MEILTRTFESHLEVRDGSDGRTVSGILTPYGESFDAGSYVEVFRQGAFSKTIKDRKAPVPLMAQHPSMLSESFPIGRSVELREDAAGLVGSFRLSNTDRGNEALELVRDGTLHSFSVGFIPVRNRKTQDGLVERIEVRLDHVGLVYNPAYEGAKVLSLRDNQIEEEEACLTLEQVRQRLMIARSHQAKINQ